MKYKTKPCEIEAYQTDKEMIIHTLEGDMKASVGDYIITGLNGEQYPCKPDIFEKKYERADKLTNYDRIRNMSIEEMAKFIEAVQTDALFLEGTIHDLEYPVEWKQYLETEVNENE